MAERDELGPLVVAPDLPAEPAWLHAGDAHPVIDEDMGHRVARQKPADGVEIIRAENPDMRAGAQLDGPHLLLGLRIGHPRSPWDASEPTRVDPHLGGMLAPSRPDRCAGDTSGDGGWGSA